MTSIFELIFDRLDGIMLSRRKDDLNRLQESDLQASDCEFGKPKCNCMHFSHEIWRCFRTRFDCLGGDCFPTFLLFTTLLGQMMLYRSNLAKTS